MRVLDFAVRFVFFATMPYLATRVAVVFPMLGVVINVALTLVVFAFAEAMRERSARSRILEKAVARRLAFETYYRENPPRPFLFYVFYPLLLPYVLSKPVMRQELLLYRGLTGGGVAILAAASAFDFYEHWLPELGFLPFITVWVMLFAVQTLALFVFLLPISTTVVKFHSERRLTELWVLFAAAAISVSIAIVQLVQKRGHIVSWVTTHRVALRTRAQPDAARAAQLGALHAVADNFAELRASTDEAGWVEGDSGQRAEDQLGLFYKSDEAYAFSLHALPARAPEVLVLQCWLPGDGRLIWKAIKKTGVEITDPKQLPTGVLGLKPRKNKRPSTKPKSAAGAKR
jgi:hypothetical protein